MVQVPNGTAVRVLWGMWLLAALIVGSVYRSNLKAMLILPKLRLPFDNLQELTQTDIPCVVPAGSALMHIILVQPNFCFFFFLFFFLIIFKKKKKKKKSVMIACTHNKNIGIWNLFTLSFQSAPSGTQLHNLHRQLSISKHIEKTIQGILDGQHAVFSSEHILNFVIHLTFSRVSFSYASHSYLSVSSSRVIQIYV